MASNPKPSYDEPQREFALELFISHASEDKELLVRPLAEFLRRLGVSVWYDEFTLKLGDSLYDSINRGIATSKYGLVVISPHFLEKGWTDFELKGLNVRQVSERSKVILPLWHGVTGDQIRAKSPTLADTVAITTGGKSIQDIAESIIVAIRPDLENRLSLYRALRRSEGERINVPLSALAPAPLPKIITTEGDVIVRCALVVNALSDAARELVEDLPTFIGDLYRDANPETELRIWEAIAAAYLQVANWARLDSAQRNSLARMLLQESMGLSSEESRSPLSVRVISFALDRLGFYMDMQRRGTVQLDSRPQSEE
ncbi:toll/interleukin-1 receptor domain-containing protein [Nonomuraea sp. NPDC004354]